MTWSLPLLLDESARGVVQLSPLAVSALALATAWTVVVPVVWGSIRFVRKTLRFASERRRFESLKNEKRAALKQAWRAADAYVAQDPPSPEAVQRYSSMALAELATELRAGNIRCETLLRVFYVSARAADEKVNCVVHVFVESAIHAAAAADRMFDEARRSSPAESGEQALRLLPPLLGIPISIKDSTNVQGADSTCGLFNRVFQPASRDATCVAQLRAAGAIPFVKTNVPALLMSYECENGIFGLTVNPNNSRFTCGGSSGGEAALIKLHGSPAGMGSDVGGSIRIPAHFCGVCGLKPSTNRVAYRGCCPEQGDEGVAPVSGPLARSVTDLVVMFRALTCVPPPRDLRDGMRINVPFQESLYTECYTKPKLTILYYREDGFIQTSPACRRAVDVAVRALHACGHELVEFHLDFTEEIMSSFFELFGADRCRTMQRVLGADYATGVIGPAIQLAQFPDCLKWLLGIVMSWKVDPVFGAILARIKERSVDEYFELLKARNRLRHRFAELLGDCDAVIGPGFTTPAPPCRSTDELSFGACGTAVFNVLDVSVVTVPVTTVDSLLDDWPADMVAAAKNVGMTRAVAQGYDATAMHGLPVGVQVVTPRMTEERALAVAQRLQEALLK